MSAYMVSKPHIDLLLSVAAFGPKDSRWDGGPRWGPDACLGFEQLAEIGQAMVDENLRSILSRYPDCHDNLEAIPGPIEQYWAVPYAHEERGIKLTPVEAIVAVRGYMYQACEHPEWPDSHVRQWCESLLLHLLSSLPGYGAAPWEWDEEEISKRRKCFRTA